MFGGAGEVIPARKSKSINGLNQIKSQSSNIDAAMHSRTICNNKGNNMKDKLFMEDKTSITQWRWIKIY